MLEAIDNCIACYRVTTGEHDDAKNKDDTLDPDTILLECLS
jgi:hypothetical protein